MRSLSPVLALALALMLIATSVAVAARADGKPPAAALAAATVRANDVLQLVALRGRWLDAVNQGDVHGILAVYRPGAVVLAENTPPLVGPGPIGRWHGRWHANADVHYALAAHLLNIDGNWALEEWTADVTVTPRGGAGVAIGGDPLQFRQSGVRVYRKDVHGRWRIDRETWSADHPAVRRFSAAAVARCTPRVC